MAYALTWLPGVLRAAGLKTVEMPGWQTRGHGVVNKIQFVVCHHTASSPKTSVNAVLNLLADGRSDLAGPLCNLALGRDGTFYAVAAGKAYHAGAGLWHGIANGNASAVGIEAMNDGVKEPWPAAQMDAYAKGCAAIAQHCGFGSEMIAGHKEYALPRGRKADPNFDMSAFRARVAKNLKPAPAAPGK